MFDNAISIPNLVSTINSVKSQVSKYGIEVSVSDMAYLYTKNKDVLNAVSHAELSKLTRARCSRTVL